MPVNNLSGTAGISFSQMQGMDIESMLMAVQGNRANLLEEQLMGEMKNVQAKNEQIAALNAKLTALTGASQMAYASADAKPETGLSDVQKTAMGLVSTPGERTEERVLLTPARAAVERSGGKGKAGRGHAGSPAVAATYTTKVKQDPPSWKPKPELAAADPAWGTKLASITTKGDLDKAVTDLKGQVDSMGSTQQMDMLRLQSLSNKRNEAYDLMTNFMKKFADKRDAIIGNMR
jgi:hypothetical protein